MEKIPCFDAQHLEAACKALADTSWGLKGSEIGQILLEMGVADVSSDMTKWKRLYNALIAVQKKYQVGNHLIMFINRAMNPVGYARDPGAFSWRRDAINVVLAFSGYYVGEDGKVVRASKATTLADARARAGRLRAALESRNVHAEVLKYCRAELIEENYFHAVLEATKGLAERIRGLSGLTSDGAALVSTALSVNTPILALNALATETEKSEQAGFLNLLIGIFGAIRNPLAHAPKIVWPMLEQDALDFLTMISLIHRKLDGASVRQQQP